MTNRPAMLAGRPRMRGADGHLDALSAIIAEFGGTIMAGQPT